jgi:guanylate kinase
LSERAPVLFVVSAPSGTGKSTLLGRVLREVPGLRFSVSHTTRAPRAGERDGRQYHFVERVAFDALIESRGLLEWAEVHGQRYGTSFAEYQRAAREGVDLLLDLDVQGAAQVRRSHPEAVSIFLLPPSASELERRLRSRGQDREDVIARRLADARVEMPRWREFDYAIVNDELEQSAAELAGVIRAERRRVKRMTGVATDILATFA